ncbi:hypothetical protein BJY04DRAFT_187188 [Aspergillus karnatakaensis]|uniref:uncharacterized protein n=1 Tax=Aspergillus karnatakaensis TaxID=1810916 RepID=UPI003CCE3890
MGGKRLRVMVDGTTLGRGRPLGSISRIARVIRRVGTICLGVLGGGSSHEGWVAV